MTKSTCRIRTVCKPPRRRRTLTGGADDVLTEVEAEPEEGRGEAGAAAASGASVGGWLGGGFRGAVMATGACAALWFSGLLGGGSVKQTRPSSTRLETSHVRREAGARVTAISTKPAISNRSTRATRSNWPRGEYRWLSYFKKQRLAKRPSRPPMNPSSKRWSISIKPLR